MPSRAQSRCDGDPEFQQLREYLRDPYTHANARDLAALLALPHQDTRYVYDRAGLMTAVTDSGLDPTKDSDDNKWEYACDRLGRQTSAIDPDSGTTTTTYVTGAGGWSGGSWPTR